MWLLLLLPMAFRRSSACRIIIIHLADKLR
jgi:hypothetical protein